MGGAQHLVPGTPAYVDACRLLTDTLARVGEKWTIMVMAALARGPERYSCIRKGAQGISQRMLTLTLRGLERDGLVSRTVHPSVPPRVDYELTDLGRTLISPLWSVYCWANENRASIEAARDRFEARK